MMTTEANGQTVISRASMSVLPPSGSLGPHRKPMSSSELQLMGNDGYIILQRRTLSPNNELFIGRDPSCCDWILDDPYLSKRHLRLYTIIYDSDSESDNAIDSLIYAEDLSRNGVFWNGSLIGKGGGAFLLSHGDRMRLSKNTVLRFVHPSAELCKSQFDIVQEKEMQVFRDDYVVTDRVLGSGAFGRVHMAVEVPTRTQLACKVINLRRFTSDLSDVYRTRRPVSAANVNAQGQLDKIRVWVERRRKLQALEQKLLTCYREVEILSCLSHPNIIALDRVFITDNTMYIFQDLITAGDLFSYLQSRDGRLSEGEAATITRQILIALEFLHQRLIVHRDLKPDNIMVTSTAAGARVVLTDFGAARRLGHYLQRMASVVGTEEYMAPEVKEAGYGQGQITPGYTAAADLWSLGAVTVILLTGISAFSDPITGEYSADLARQCNLQYLHQSSVWGLVRFRPRNFVAGLLVLRDGDRLTATQALQHPWFTNEFHKVDFEDLYKRTVKDWRPRTPKAEVVTFQNSEYIKYLKCSRMRSSTQSKTSNLRPKNPVEAPHKPFPRHVHSRFWPKKTERKEMSVEVKQAIQEHWPSDDKLSTSSRRTSTDPSSECSNVVEQKDPVLHEDVFRTSSKLRQSCTNSRPRKRPRGASSIFDICDGNQADSHIESVDSIQEEPPKYLLQNATDRQDHAVTDPHHHTLTASLEFRPGSE